MLGPCGVGGWLVVSGWSVVLGFFVLVGARVVVWVVRVWKKTACGVGCCLREERYLR